MKHVKFLTLFFLMVSISISSCNSEKKKMIDNLSGSYSIDTLDDDYKMLKQILPADLILTLSKNGSYYFSPKTEIMNGFDGQWDLSDNDFAYYIFKCKNGQYQQNRALFITVTIHDKDYKFSFDKKVK